MGDADVAEGDAALEALASTLGPFGFRWLIACAALPTLRLPITLHLGAALKRADGEPPPSEETVLALASLPWFRQGWMPDAWRVALLARQTAKDRATVRDALADLLYAVLDAPKADALGRVTVARIPQAPPLFVQDSEAWRVGLPSTLAESDPTLERVIAHTNPHRRNALILGIGVAAGIAGLAVVGYWVSLYFHKRSSP